MEIYEDPVTKLQKEAAAKAAEAEKKGEKNDPGAEMMRAMMVYFAGKTPIKDFVAKQDLVLTLGEVNGMGQTCERVAWAMSKGGGEIPWYVHELPVVVASVGHPFLLADVPQARRCV